MIHAHDWKKKITLISILINLHMTCKIKSVADILKGQKL